MKKILAIFTIALGISSAAQAGLLIEPYLGYRFGDVKWTHTASGTTGTDSHAGLGYGMRLGYKFLLPWVAVDYMGFSGSAKRSIPSVPGAADLDYSGYNLGAIVGVDLPVMFRLWAGYGLSNNLTWKGQAGNSDMKFTGGYTKVGLGFKGFPFVSINLEYIMDKFTKVEDNTGSFDMDPSYTTFDSNLMMFSVSMPFNL